MASECTRREAGTSAVPCQNCTGQFGLPVDRARGARACMISDTQPTFPVALKMRLPGQQLTYLRRLYKACGPKPGPCAESRAVARAIGATEEERMDIEDALTQRGYIKVGDRPGTVALTDAGRKRALR